MAKIEFRVDDDLASSFAKAYPGRGERSALLRHSVRSFVASKNATPVRDSATVKQPSNDLMQRSPKGRRRALRPDRTVVVSVRLTPEQYIGIEAKALAFGIDTSAYIRGLVDACLDRAPQWSSDHREALTAATSQLRKAGVNLNQLTFLIRSALKVGKPFPVAQDQLEKVLEAVNALKAALFGVLESRDRYWQLKGSRDE